MSLDQDTTVVEIRVSGNDITAWTGELGRESVIVGIRPELVKDQDYVYVRLRLPQSYQRPASAEITSKITDSCLKDIYPRVNAC